jgi:XTP/dITP diphosphohydrolase
VPSPLEHAVEVMDQLRSPGGCPWDAEQTHASLARYLLEETYEVLEAIESNDVALLREELGDLLLQVLFHARLAQELPEDERFSIDEVAGDLTDKLIRRHPHVFGDAGDASDVGDSARTVTDVAALNETWEKQKVAEKGRTSAVDGVPLAQPALALAAKLVSRANRAGLDIPSSGAEADEIGQRIFEIVRDAAAVGVDPEGALRRVTMKYRDAIVAAEQAGSPHDRKPEHGTS